VAITELYFQTETENGFGYHTSNHDQDDEISADVFVRSLSVDQVSPALYREHLKGKYHCTVDLLFDQFRNVALCSTKFSSTSTEAHF